MRASTRGLTISTATTPAAAPAYSLDDIHIGTHGTYSEEVAVKIHFHQFSQLNEKPGQFVYSPIFICHGMRWKIKLHPRGSEQSGDDASAGNKSSSGYYQDGMHGSRVGSSNSKDSADQNVSIYLCYEADELNNDKPCPTKFAIKLPKLNINRACSMQRTFSDDANAWGWRDYASRQLVLDKGCVDDTLTVAVIIRVLNPKQPQWVPQCSLQKEMLHILDNRVMADIAFVVGPGDEQEIMFANTTILMMRIPSMKDMVDLAKAEYANGGNRYTATVRRFDEGTSGRGRTSETEKHGDQRHAAVAPSSRNTDRDLPGASGIHGSNVNAVVRLPDVNPKHFRSILRFVYADDTSLLESESNLKELLAVANRFGCWKLKLVIEGMLIDGHLDFDSSVDLLLFADGHSCAMLQEAAIKVIVQNSSSLVRHPAFSKLIPCVELMTEIHQAITHKTANATDDEFGAMSVGNLYRILEDNDVVLECDMSRHMLLAMVRSLAKPTYM